MCKCAILPFRLPLQGKGCPGDCGEAHLPNISGGSTQSVQGFRGAEIRDHAEIFLVKADSRIDAAADKEHEAHAVLQGHAVCHREIEVIQLLQKAVFFIVFQL